MTDEQSIISSTNNPTVKIGGLADETEVFAWHHDIASKPAQLVIYPYRAKANFQGELMTQLEQANANNQAHINLNSKKSSLEGELLAFDDDEFLSDKEAEEKAEIVKGLERVKAKLATLEGLPRNGNDVIADFFVSLIKSHNLVDENMQPLPVTREGFLLIEPTKFQSLYEDLTSFLSSGRKKGKRR